MIQTREDWKRVMENDKFFEYDCDGRVRWEIKEWLWDIE